MAGQRALHCIFRPNDKEEMQVCVEREFATPSFNYGQHRNLKKKGKQSQEFPKKLDRLVIYYFLPKLLVTYGTCAKHVKN